MNPDQSTIPIIFNPPDNSENQYIAILVKGITKNGFEISPLDDLFRSRAHFQSIRLVHINWFENLDESSSSSMWKSFFRKVVALLAIKASGKKLVWTMHNRISHEKGSGKLSRILVKFILKSADAVVIHSVATEQILLEIYPNFRGQILHIPHPHFIGIYGPMQEHHKAENEPLKLLFLGAVKPYKNLELLIRVCRAFGEAVHLIIAGKAANSEYAEELVGLASGAAQIELRLGFVEDDQLPSLIGDSELLVLPYDLRSSLNSGTVILAFSYARTVICPRIGTIDDLSEGHSELFTYTYHSAAEQERNLRNAIQKALALKQTDPLLLLQMGRKMQELVRKQNDPMIAINGLSALYRDLLD